MRKLIPPLAQMPLFAGPCVIEDEGLVFEVAQELKRQLQGLSIDFYFKASFDKANRTSIDGFRGPGLKKGLEILAKIKSQLGLQLITDFHSMDQVEAVAEVVDVLQLPAFLCRQTDLVVAGAEAALKHGKKLNIKKGQFLAPWDCKNIVEKVRAVQDKINLHKNSEPWFYITERGSSFGYNTLVVDMTSFYEIHKFGVPVIYDATHSVQKPGAGADGKSTGGNREHIEVLARSAMAAGADGLFMETHPRPEQAKSDGPNAFPLANVRPFIESLIQIKNL